MSKEEIKEFLKNKPGYLKEGGKRLRKVLLRKGFQTTVAECKLAIREVTQELKFNPVPTTKKTEAKVLLYDIETAYGLARVWNPGWKLNVGYKDFVKMPRIICISYKWLGEDEVHTVRWDSKQDDKLLLEEFIKELNKADYSIAHNGDKFDLPWIRARAMYHGLDMFPKYTTVDTLKIARYNFRFPSNRLDDLGDYLGVGRKIPTDRQLWVDTVCNGDLDALQEMVEYCEQDVFLLEDVYDKLRRQTLPAVHAGVLNGETKQTSPYNGGVNLELVKTTTTKAGTIKRLMKCKDTGKYFEMSNTNYNKYIEIND